MSTPEIDPEDGDDLENLESFRERARAFIRANLRPVTVEDTRRERSNLEEEEELAAIRREREIQRMLFDAGLAGICFPRAYGGQGLTPAHQAVLNEEQVGYEYPTRLQVPTLSPCATVLLEFGAEEQKHRHLPAILRGEEIWMQFLSEPSGGSDVAGALTTAVRDGEQWILNGSKVWTTGAWWADWGLCLARTNWDVPKHRGLTVFMLPIHQSGVEVHRIEMLDGSREFCQEFMTDVVVPDSDRIGEVDDGWTVGTRWMFHERMLYSSPFVTEPPGMTHGMTDAASVLHVAEQRGAIDDPSVRDLVGEARMLEVVGVAFGGARHRRDSSGCHVRPGRRHRAAVQGHRSGKDQHDRLRRRRLLRCRVVQRRHGVRRCGQLHHAPGGEHRRRDDRDGPKRDQRASAGHAP